MGLQADCNCQPCLFFFVCCVCVLVCVGLVWLCACLRVSLCLFVFVSLLDSSHPPLLPLYFLVGVIVGPLVPAPRINTHHRFNLFPACSAVIHHSSPFLECHGSATYLHCACSFLVFTLWMQAALWAGVGSKCTLCILPLHQQQAFTCVMLLSPFSNCQQYPYPFSTISLYLHHQIFFL